MLTRHMVEQASYLHCHSSLSETGLERTENGLNIAAAGLDIKRELKGFLLTLVAVLFAKAGKVMNESLAPCRDTQQLLKCLTAEFLCVS